MRIKLVNPKSVAFIGMLAALSTVLMTISIPLPFAPSFLKFDIAELPALFAGFFMGPLSGCMVIIIKITLKLLTQGTDTAFVGEMMNVIGSCAFILPASIIYKRIHTQKGALISLGISTVFVSVVTIFLNACIAFPMYSALYGIPMEAILEMGSSVNPFIHDNVTLMLYGVFPFNLMKHGVTSVVTYLIYKRCGNALRAGLSISDNKKGYAAEGE